MGFNDEDGFTPNWRNADEGFGGSQQGSNGIDGNFARHEAFARELRRFAFSGDDDSGTDKRSTGQNPVRLGQRQHRRECLCAGSTGTGETVSNIPEGR